MLKIGEFSKLAQVSVKTLRYYDELGLFKAEWVDRYSGYRYYSLDQLPRLNRILALRDLGFSLVQIERIIREDQDVVGLCRLMELRMTELEHEVQVQQERLNRVATRLKLIQEEGHAPRYDVVSKELPSGLVAGIRDTVDGFAAIVSLAGELHSFLVRRGVSPGPLSPFTAIYFDDEYLDSGADVEVAVQVRQALRSTGRVRIHQLSGAETAASLVHVGGHDRLPDAYRTLLAWRQANGYRQTGPSREVYLQGLLAADPPDQLIIEVQLPVQVIPSFVIPGVKDRQSMEPTIVNKDAFMVVGLPFTGLLSHEPFEDGTNNEIGDKWDEFSARGAEVKHVSGAAVGLCFGMPNDKEPWYIAGVEVERVDEIPDGMVSRSVPAQKYAVFACTLETLGQTYRYINEEWQPKSGYERAPAADFEYYDGPFDPAHPEAMGLSVYWPIR